jgi:hypothetical protein
MNQDELASNKQYRDAGFWIAPKLFDDSFVAALRTACSQVLSGNLHEPPSPYFQLEAPQAPGELRRAFNASFVDPVIRTAIHESPIGELAAHLMEVPQVRLWYSQIIEKPSAKDIYSSTDQGNVGWHQDYRYWQCCEHTNMVTAWISLQETTSMNGAMRFAVGSHNWGLLQATKGFNTKNLDDLRTTLRVGLPHDWIEQDCELLAGQVSFHHALTLHASGPNKSTEPRIGVAVHMMPGTSKRLPSGTCHHSLTFLNPMPAYNANFVSDQWPIIWDALSNK